MKWHGNCLKVINDWLTAKLLRSPSDGYTMSVTYLSVFGERRAQTLAITAHIASARIQHAPEIIRRQNTHKLVVSHICLAQQNCVQLFVVFFLKTKFPAFLFWNVRAQYTKSSCGRGESCEQFTFQRSIQRALQRDTFQIATISTDCISSQTKLCDADEECKCPVME